MASSSPLQLTELSPTFSAYVASPQEANHMHKEIFVDNCYELSTPLPDKPFIIDAGANVGMFTIWQMRQRPNARILAFEPAPVTFEALQKNLHLHDITSDVDSSETTASETPSQPNVTLHQCGLGKEPHSSMTLTYYPKLPGSSTLFRSEKEMVRELVLEEWGMTPMDAMFEKPEEISIPIKRLSTFLRQEEVRTGKKLERIDLLKVDVEGAEVDVLEGLDDEDLKLVRNVTMEIFDVDGKLELAKQLLESKEFKVDCELAEWSPKRVKFWLVKGKREG